jgi:hypothetical protein
MLAHESNDQIYESNDFSRVPPVGLEDSTIIVSLKKAGLQGKGSV